MVDLVELRISRTFITGRFRRGVVGLVTVCTPVPFVGSGVGIEDDHAPVPISVRYEEFIGLRINGHIGGLAEIHGIVAVVPIAPSSDLQQKLSFVIELQDLVFAGSICTAPGNPDVVLVVDEDAVLIAV